MDVEKVRDTLDALDRLKAERYVVDKGASLKEFGFEVGLNYKTTSDYYAGLRKLCPSGIDVYFDNVGGPLADAAIRLLKPRGRIVICGQLSQYNLDKAELAPRWFTHILLKQARIEGFLIPQFADRYEQGLRKLNEWYLQGRLKYRESIAEGLENAPAAFLGMLEGRNIGKQLVKVAEAQ